MTIHPHYFDYAAATPLCDEALQAMLPYTQEVFYNPSALYLRAQAVKKDLSAARASVAQAIGARPTEIIFTAGGTEANNLAIQGVMGSFTAADCVVSAIEHDSVLQPATVYNHSIASVDEKGQINIESLQKAISDTTVLISVILANNEIGTILDIKNIVQLARDIRQNRHERGITMPLYVHTDACQALNYIDLHVARLGVDLMTLNAGKIYGPKQCGALYVKAGTRIAPLIRGGGHEWGLRSGTENVAACIGFAAALRRTKELLPTEPKRVLAIRDELIKELISIKDVSLNGAKGIRRIANNIHITIAGVDNERLLMELDELGYMVATGSACSASNDVPSHVLRAIGKTNEESRQSIRITLGRGTTQQACEQLAKSIKEVVAKTKA